MATWTIRRLDKTHDCSAFDCGQPMLNEWLKDPRHLFLPMHEIRKLKLEPFQ